VSVAAYREGMAGFADMRTLCIGYAHLPEDELFEAFIKSDRGGTA